MLKFCTCVWYIWCLKWIYNCTLKAKAKSAAQLLPKLHQFVRGSSGMRNLWMLLSMSSGVHSKSFVGETFMVILKIVICFILACLYIFTLLIDKAIRVALNYSWNLCSWVNNYESFPLERFYYVWYIPSASCCAAQVS